METARPAAPSHCGYCGRPITDDVASQRFGERFCSETHADESPGVRAARIDAAARRVDVDDRPAPACRVLPAGQERWGARLKRVKISPASIVLARGERVRVSVRARNTGTRELATRVSHRTEPATEANHLALLQCPLLVPVRLAAGEAEEYESEYLLLADVPEGVKALTVTYRFPTSPAGTP